MRRVIGGDAAYWFVLFLVIAAVAIGGAVRVLLGVATFFALLAIYAGRRLVALSAWHCFQLKTHAPLQTRVGIATGLVVVGDLVGSGASPGQVLGRASRNNVPATPPARPGPARTNKDLSARATQSYPLQARIMSAAR
jgi:hypothetical protein